MHDIALLKALYWKMFDLFRWLLTRPLAHKSLLQDKLKAMAGDDRHIEDMVGSQMGGFIGANFAQLDQFLGKFMPCLVVENRHDIVPNSVRHIDP